MQQQLLGMANSTQQNQQMLDQMTALATTVSTLQAQLEDKNQNRAGRNNGGNHGRDRDNDRRGRNGGCGGRGGARRPFQYCWSHGKCSHSGPDCESPSDGHNKDAIYSNMQGGSTNCCHWLPTCQWKTVLTPTRDQLLYTLVPPKPNLTNHTAIVDTGATGHYLDPAAKPHCINVHTTNSGPSVQVANGKRSKQANKLSSPSRPNSQPMPKPAISSIASSPAPLFLSANSATTTASPSSPSTT
jgi:hypothetical protein